MDARATLWNLQLKSGDSFAVGEFVFILLSDVVRNDNVRCVGLCLDGQCFQLSFTPGTLINADEPFVLARASR